jgi:hypothetical protein
MTSSFSVAISLQAFAKTDAFRNITGFIGSPELHFSFLVFVLLSNVFVGLNIILPIETF